MTALKIAYLTSQYPEFHETFIAREVEGLKARSVDIKVYSLKPPAMGDFLYPAHRSFVRYLPFFFSGAVWKSNLKQLFTRPDRYLMALTDLLRIYATRPVELIKALAVFPKTVAYAEEIGAAGAVVHAHWITVPTSMALVIRRLTGTRISATAHAWDIFLSPTNELRHKISQLSGVVTCTGYNVQHLQELCHLEDKNKIVLNYHGLDEKIFAATASGDKPDNTCLRITAVGRLVEQKGFAYLVEAVNQLSERGIPVELVVIGEGPLLDKLKAMIRPAAQNAIVFSGRLGHAQTLGQMRASHVLAAPSVVAKDGDRDGIPNVILEAMGVGLPIVASAVSGIPEVVKDGISGWLVPSADARALADALAAVWQNLDDAGQRGQQARAYVIERFSVTRNVAEFLDLLEKFHHE